MLRVQLQVTAEPVQQLPATEEGRGPCSAPHSPRLPSLPPDTGAQTPTSTSRVTRASVEQIRAPNLAESRFLLLFQAE